MIYNLGFVTVMLLGITICLIYIWGMKTEEQLLSDFISEHYSISNQSAILRSMVRDTTGFKQYVSNYKLTYKIDCFTNLLLSHIKRHPIKLFIIAVIMTSLLFLMFTEWAYYLQQQYDLNPFDTI